MFESVFTLRQETPIIHFLHDQPGATLRATELKPAFDKWLIRKFDGKKVPEHWISHSNEEGRGDALDYKVSIVPTGHNREIALEAFEKEDRETREKKWHSEDYPHLLANMGGKSSKEELKNLTMFDGAKVSIRTWHDDLLELIKIELPVFLAQHNFGNRSFKGFGSFTCTQVDEKKITPPIPPLKYVFEWSAASPYDKRRGVFAAINWFYKCLRSGINQVKDGKTDFYFKSLIFAYAKSKGDEWDKRSIKAHFFGNGASPPQLLDYRDWLGLSTEEFWGRKYKNVIIKKSSPDIERFASPLFFKPIREGGRFKVYFGVFEDSKEFKEASNGFKTAQINVHLKNKPDLPLIPASSFSFSEYLKFALEQTNIEDHLFAYDNHNINSTDFWIFRDFIAPIFSSIHKNLGK